MFRLSHLGLCGLIFLSACAIPRWETPPQRFVPDIQLGAVELARQAEDLFLHHRHTEAELRLRQALYLKPADNLRANLADSLVAQERYDEAIDLYKLLVDTNPRSVDYRLRYGRALFASGKFETAYREISGALELLYSKKDLDLNRAADIERSLAVLSFKAGWEEQALCHSIQSIGFNQDPQNLSRHTRLLLALGREAQAEQIVTDYFATDGAKQDGALYHALAMVRFDQGDYREARKFEEKALDASRSPSANGAESRLEMLMVKALSEEKLGLDKSSSEEAADKEKKKSKQKVFLSVEDTLASISRQDQKITLYWPDEVLAAYEKSGERHMIEAKPEPEA